MMKEDYVCFMCARCKQLVKLDSSFDSIDDQAVQDIIASSKATSNADSGGSSNQENVTIKQKSGNNVRLFSSLSYQSRQKLANIFDAAAL